MQSSTIRNVVIGATLAVGCAFQSSAVTVQRFDIQAATGMCQGESAVYGSNLRFRPLSADNIGTTNQYINCSLQGDDQSGGVRGSTNIGLRVQNASTITQSVSCTLVNGFRSSPTVANATYTNKAVNVSPGGSSFITYLPGDITPVPASGTITLPNVQCLLPASTGLLYVYKFYNEDVGA